MITPATLVRGVHSLLDLPQEVRTQVSMGLATLMGIYFIFRFIATLH